MPRFTLGSGLVLASLLTTSLVPDLARAQPPGLQLAGDGARDRSSRRQQRQARLNARLELEDFQREPVRKGFYIGATLVTGATAEPNSFIPSVGHRMEIGGGLSDRLTLGISGGLTGHLGVKDGTAGVADIVLQRFVHRGLFVKLGVGATSHAASRNRIKRPGLGGIVGGGWEFRPLRMLAVSLAAEYEGRVRTDGIYTNAFQLGFGLRFYPDFPKRR